MKMGDTKNGLYKFGLTPRQSEVFLMVSNGYSNREIANALKVSPETIKTHLKVIFRRTKINKRTEAAHLVNWA